MSLSALDNRMEDDWMDAHIEAYLDGDLSAAERHRFEERLAECPDWQRELRRARTIRDGLRDLSTPACPPHVTQTVLARTRRAADRPPRRAVSVSEQVLLGCAARRKVGWKPVLTAALLFAIVIAAPLISPPLDAPQHPAYSRADIREAAAEVRWTLTYVAHVTQEARQTVRQDVLEDHVAEPLQEAFTPFTILSNTSIDS